MNGLIETLLGSTSSIDETKLEFFSIASIDLLYSFSSTLLLGQELLPLMLNFKPAFTAENGDFEGCFGLSTAPNTWISPLYKDQGHRGNTARLRD